MRASNQYSPLLLAAILVAAASSAAYFLAEETLGRKELGTAFLSMLGTFLGAILAFRLGEHKEHLAEIRDRKIALNKALFTVLRQYNAMHWLQRNMAPYKEPYELAFNCPAIRPPEYKDLTYDLDSLAFLFDEQVDPGLLMQVSLEQEGFFQSLESLRVRNELYVDEVQPLISKLGFNRRAVPAAEFQSALGARLFEGAMNGAALARQNIDESCRSLLKLHGQLFAVAKQLFPDTKFVKLAAEA